MIIDTLRELEQRCGLKPMKLPDFARSDPHTGEFASNAMRLTQRLEKHLNLRPCPGQQLGSRVKAIEVYMSQQFRAGDRVTYTGNIAPAYTGVSGTVGRVSADGSQVHVVMDNDQKRRERYFPADSLVRESAGTNNIANAATAAISGFFATPKPSSVTTAARELLAATTLASLAEAKKKRAKEALQTLGITLPEYRPGTVVAYDDGQFKIEAVTKEGSTRLSQTELVAAMRRAGLSQSKINTVITAATVPNKPATSIVVTQQG